MHSRVRGIEIRTYRSYNFHVEARARLLTLNPQTRKAAGSLKDLQ